MLEKNLCNDIGKVVLIEWKLSKAARPEYALNYIINTSRSIYIPESGGNERNSNLVSGCVTLVRLKLVFLFFSKKGTMKKITKDTRLRLQIKCDLLLNGVAQVDVQKEVQPIRAE
jgi:hypothetical protein